MKRLRRAAALFLVPLLIALLAAPAAASSGTPKTNAEHESWLVLDPVPERVDGSEVTISGKVSGSFEMSISSYWFTKHFAANGKFSATLQLVNGQNKITVSGRNRAGRVLNATLVVVAYNGSDTGGGDNGTGDGGDGSGDGNDPVVTVPALDCGDMIYVGRRYNQNGQAYQIRVETGCGALVADGTSLYNMLVVVVDSVGNLIPSYGGVITVASSDANAVEVLNPYSRPISGISQVTLRGRTAGSPSVIAVSTPGLEPVVVTFTPAAP